MSFQNSSSLYAVIVAAFFSSATAHAEEAVAPDSIADTIIVTASRVTDEMREIGSAVSVITRDDLSRGQITFVKDALRDLPGVVITSDRPGDLTGMSIRGSSNDEILWLIDGIELGDPSAISTEFRSDHLASADIDRIEVLRGNQSSLYGSDAIGGVVNIITKRATQDGLSANVEGEAGAYGTRMGAASILGKSGAVDFRLTASGYRHDGLSVADPKTGPAGAITEKDEYWRYGFSGRIGLAASDNLSFQLIGLWQDSFSDLDNAPDSDNDDTAKSREHAFAGQGSFKSSDGHFKADLTASRYAIRRLYHGIYNLPEGDMYKGYKDSVRLALSYSGIEAVTLAAGANWEQEKTDQLTSFSGDFQEHISTRSAYGEVALRPLTGMTLTGAVRVDDNSRFGTFDTYRGTIAYLVGPLKLRASYGTGAKAPGLYQLFDPRSGNPYLKAETSRGGDVGFDLALKEGLALQMSYFFNHKRNEISYDYARDTSPPHNLSSEGYSQYGRSRAQGVEIGLTAQPFAWLNLSQSFGFTDHEVDNSKTGDGPYRDSGKASYSGTTAVTLTPDDRSSLTARLRYRDGDKSGWAGDTRAYAVVDLLGSYALSEKVEIYGRVVNLFDKWYQASYGTQTLGLSAYGGVRLSF